MTATEKFTGEQSLPPFDPPSYENLFGGRVRKRNRKLIKILIILVILSGIGMFFCGVYRLLKRTEPQSEKKKLETETEAAETEAQKNSMNNSTTYLQFSDSEYFDPLNDENNEKEVIQADSASSTSSTHSSDFFSTNSH